jgi:hypothetical protein
MDTQLSKIKRPLPPIPRITPVSGERVAPRLALDRAVGALFDCSTRILFHFVAKVFTPHPPGK